MDQVINSELVMEESGEDTLLNKYLTFALGDEQYGIEIRNVTEIVGVTPITLVPDTPAYVKGIINLRGKIIPVIDMRAYFSMPPRDYDDRTCFVVAEVEDLMVAFVVDYVCEVTAIEDIAEVPAGDSAALAYMSGIGKYAGGVTLLLDCFKLLGLEHSQQRQIA